MAFLETPRFTDRLARGVIGGPEFTTDVVALASGFESRGTSRARARRMYDAATTVRTLADFQEIEQHFHVVMGRLHGFRLRDVADYQVALTDGLLRPRHGAVQVGTLGVGFGVPLYQLCKQYVRGALVHQRDIRKPVSGRVAVRRGGSLLTVGGSPGNIAIDTTTGEITFVADATRNVTAVTVGATTQVTVQTSALPNLVVGDRLYLTGLAGADAALLNNLSHAITNISSLTYTLATNTAGKTITVGAGVAYEYPQADETLTWEGQFDVPVRFDTDRLRRRVLQRQENGSYLVQCDEIPLIEIFV